ncbi:MAG: hypothetical protein LBD10_11055 [Desulfobulbus sp.]|uniref:hypothetical protein n=1 Tax=Desulfobulbus sp. TaxID=895 RepID=UPI00284112E1|nr:hypothetical protein [Desulfobulbus sp.]MDR2550725.1 hypothetical protein [Desulfobulbus sp.]
MGDFEDLTLFANESFDTGDVDLFEFTSEESSPLTRLKSIILSLDWEINDEILQELEDELGNLKAMWQGDKVAEVYLQGLSKIGSYIRTKGAYAHPNSIKLLLTFFYNFEKIISSTQITGEEITQLLKGDVRKFKILQYQINQSEAAEAETSDVSAHLSVTSNTAANLAGAMTAHETCKQLKAAILSLDWEVTNESLRQFNERIDAFRSQVADNKPALVLIQGLQALGDYIADERADSHPESFILLHSFNDALDEFVKTGDEQLSQEKMQEILVDRINRLNNLKILIASPTGGEVDAQKVDQVFEELDPAISTGATPAPAATPPVVPEPEPVLAPAAPSLELDAASTEDLVVELDTLFVPEAIPAMESAEVQYPDEVLPPDAIHPVDDELADDFIESHLSSKRGLTPALSDADETAGFDAGAEPLDLPTQNDLADQLDFLFAEAGNEEEPAVTLSALDSEELTLAVEDEEGPLAALTEDEEPERDFVVAALSDAEIPADTDEPDRVPGGGIEETDFGSLDIQSKLDSFFADADEQQDETLAPVPEFETDNDLAIAALSDLAALADEDEGNQDLSKAEKHEDFGSLEMQSELDSFFADTDQEQDEVLAAAPEIEMDSDLVTAFGDVAALADEGGSDQALGKIEEEAGLGSLAIESELDGLFTDSDEEEEEILATIAEPEDSDVVIASLSDVAALADDDEDEVDRSLNELEAEADSNTLEIQGKLDNFFAATDGKQSRPAEVTAMEVEEIEHTLFFNEADKLQTALADSGEEGGFSEDEEMAALNFTPMDEIEEKLDLFFGADEEEELGDDALLAGSLEESLGFDLADDESIAVPDVLAHLDASQPMAAAMETATPRFEAKEEQATAPLEVDELTMALEASIDDDQQPATDAPESKEIQLAALGALLPLVVRTPSRDNLAESAAMIATFKQADLSPAQHSLVQLLDSTLTLLVRLPTKDHAATEKLVNYLYGQLRAGEPQADVLAEAIGRFTAWMQEAGKIMPVVPAAGEREQQHEPAYTYTAKELYFELSELRSYMREEFAKLQHDMQHHK